jgi:hypothetical protein
MNAPFASTRAESSRGSLPIKTTRCVFVLAWRFVGASKGDRVDLSAAPPATSTVFSAAKNPVICHFQQPMKYQLIINLKTAKALCIYLAPTMLALADEVIE